MKCPTCGGDLVLTVMTTRTYQHAIADDGELGEGDLLVEEGYGDDIVSCASCHEEFSFNYLADKMIELS